TAIKINTFFIMSSFVSSRDSGLYQDLIILNNVVFKRQRQCKPNAEELALMLKRSLFSQKSFANIRILQQIL
ncbi:MAG: hypothetical protein IJ647_11435, partial [Prevotella sp.]|nr:hypothetical protein [Prevotella sp.]